ncbi:MAG: MerR family transcriptional regulator [Oscillospiraceae bacterium]|nr:MerR family transcriptional regulator [Oscillospiraceae bacterium]
MRYKIGDVAKILGISTDLIRYYEKKGVVSPEKGEHNSYRYYDTWDINFLIDCLWYKNFGFSIDEISVIESETTYDSLLERIDDMSAEIEASAKRYQLLHERLVSQKETLENVRSLIGKCEVTMGPDFIYYLNRHNFEYESDSTLQTLSRRWLKYMPFSTRYFEIPVTAHGSEDKYSWGFSLDMHYVEEFDVKYAPPVERFESRPCIHSAFKSSGKNAFSPKHMDFMFKYAKTHGLKPVGNAFGNLVCSVVDNGKLTGFFEAWLPVEE